MNNEVHTAQTLLANVLKRCREDGGDISVLAQSMIAAGIRTMGALVGSDRAADLGQNVVDTERLRRAEALKPGADGQGARVGRDIRCWRARWRAADAQSGLGLLGGNPVPFRCQLDEEVMQALVTAGAMVAVAHGAVEQIERDELVSFIDHQGFVPSISPERIATVFDARVRELDDRNAPNIIVDKFRPVAGLALGSVVIRVAQRAAAADGKLNQREVQAMDLIRLILVED
jgi:tellurite resistance protein